MDRCKPNVSLQYLWLLFIHYFIAKRFLADRILTIALLLQGSLCLLSVTHVGPIVAKRYILADIFEWSCQLYMAKPLQSAAWLLLPVYKNSTISYPTTPSPTLYLLIEWRVTSDCISCNGYNYPGMLMRPASLINSCLRPRPQLLRPRQDTLKNN